MSIAAGVFRGSTPVAQTCLQAFLTNIFWRLVAGKRPGRSEDLRPRRDPGHSSNLCGLGLLATGMVREASRI